MTRIVKFGTSECRYETEYHAEQMARALRLNGTAVEIIREHGKCPRCEERPGIGEAFPGLKGYPGLCEPCERVIEEMRACEAGIEGA